MKKTKKEWNRFALYDYYAIEEHLEEMAEQGWLLDKIGAFFWTYQQIEPKQINFAVTYFQKGGYDTEEKKDNLKKGREFCRESGWTPIGWQGGKMQIFYHTKENFVPMETDPVVFVEKLHNCMKRENLLYSLFLFVFCSVLLGIDIYRIWTKDIFIFLSYKWIPLMLLEIIGVLWTVLQSVDYFFWYRKAVHMAEQGIMPSHKAKLRTCINPLKVCFIIFVIAMLIGNMYLIILLDGITFFYEWKRWYYADQTVKQPKETVWWKDIQMWKDFFKTDAKYIGVIFVCTVVLFVGVEQYGDLHSSKPVGTGMRQGEVIDVYKDELPLQLADFMETEGEEWSFEKLNQETVFLKKSQYYQLALTKEEDAPELSYTILEVKKPYLYQQCRESQIHKAEEYGNLYAPIDAVPWGVQEAYVFVMDGYEKDGSYMLIDGNRIIKLELPQKPTKEQMEIIGEKLCTN